MGFFFSVLLSHFSCVRLCATPQTAAHQAPPSLGFSRQEHWSGLPFPFPNAWKWKVKGKLLSHVRLFATPWTAVYQTPWRKAWQPNSVFLTGESHGQRSLAGNSPQGQKESDKTEATQHTWIYLEFCTYSTLVDISVFLGSGCNEQCCCEYSSGSWSTMAVSLGCRGRNKISKYYQTGIQRYLLIYTPTNSKTIAVVPCHH